MEDKLYWILLSLCFSYGSDKPNEIISHYSDPKDFFHLSVEEMLNLGFLSEKDVRVLKKTSILRAEKIVKDCAECEISIATMNDEIYPKRLMLIYGPPVVIYYKGNISEIDENVAIAVVGTRHANEYTSKVTTWITSDLAKAGAIVVSGCAVGIDACAHFGALKGKGRTIGVLGCGIDINYPAENELLKKEIVKRNGGLISEIPPKVSPKSTYFPTRNRLIAGLSLGVLITHAPIRSGALITAEHALEQGKEVYCLPPYSVIDTQAMGVMKYIRDGSTVVACAEDILIDFYYGYADKLEKDNIIGDYVYRKKLEGKADKIHVDAPKVTNDASSCGEESLESLNEKREAYLSKNQAVIASFDDQHAMVFSKLDITPKFIDEITNESMLNVSVVLSVLTELEILGMVTSYGGKRYSLNIGTFS